MRQLAKGGVGPKLLSRCLLSDGVELVLWLGIRLKPTPKVYLVRLAMKSVPNWKRSPHRLFQHPGGLIGRNQPTLRHQFAIKAGEPSVFRIIGGSCFFRQVISSKIVAQHGLYHVGITSLKYSPYHKQSSILKYVALDDSHC